MNKPLETIEKLQADILAELEPLKKDLASTLADALKQYETIKKYEPSFVIKELLKPFGIEPTEEKKPRNKKKIGVLIAKVLGKDGKTLPEIVKALPDETEARIKYTCGKAKTKGTKKDRNPFYVDKGKYFPKK